jgi:type I restriction enzyme R subunit
MAFDENTRVKIPAILHLTQLGYEYVSLKDAQWDIDTNIFTDIFCESIRRINTMPNPPRVAVTKKTKPRTDDYSYDSREYDKQPRMVAEDVSYYHYNANITDEDISSLLLELKDLLDYEDLGSAFHKRILSTTGIRLIDFEDLSNNSFHVCTELTCKNGEDEFRPDITILINGMPLVFIEVKKPNNIEGISAERNRINVRLRNKKFRRFLNATQFMIFSNNMEYDNEAAVPIQGAFYASVSQTEAAFNCFREEDVSILDDIAELDEEVENFILKDNNLVAIKESPEYITNKSQAKPTNRILSSLLRKERLAFVLKYGLVYVDDVNGMSKHIMRYPQLFATLAIERAIEAGTKKGIIWHTQGSGKTALAYFNVAYLTDYFQRRYTVPKFYFIVDRLDLLTQAQTEFESRKLRVKIANGRDEFVRNITSQGAVQNDSGDNEITVVNIQKFSEDSRATKQGDYDLKVQRIYFLDEVHRSYNPRGSFLANLMTSDPNAIFIGLTGTPLIKQKLKAEGGRKAVTFNSRDVFGDYIHKYYYNLSIEDGYTLRLIREGIETRYQLQLKKILNRIELLKGSAKKSEVFAHTCYVTELAKYIVGDFERSRVRLNDATIGGMVVCDTSEQAKKLFCVIVERHPQIKASLILHDVDDKNTRRNNRDDFKRGKTDLLIVFNMLLTGFDAHRLKKLYLNRVVKDHNLLQTLTRVNRPYKNFRYGFVVDFADIRKEFDKTNAAYFEELQEEIGDEWDKYNNLFKSAEEIATEIADIKEKLFAYDIENAEVFSEQINEIDDKKIILEVKSALENARTLGNLIRLYDHDDLADKLDFEKLKLLLTEVNNRLALINQREALENVEGAASLINLAIEDIIFVFRKVSEKELQLGIVDDFKERIRKTREAMLDNFDHADAVYVSLAEELERIFKKKKVTEMSTEDIQENIVLLRGIYDRISEQNRRDALLKAKYEHDEKFTRIHKRIVEKKPDWKLTSILSALLDIKHKTDDQILYQKAVLNNEPYFAQEVQRLVIPSFDGNALKLDSTTARQINDLIVGEYMREYRGVATA